VELSGRPNERRLFSQILAAVDAPQSPRASIVDMERGASLEHPVVGWVLGTLFPNFDVRARPIKRRVTHTAIASLPIEFQPALLAGLARVSVDPAVLHDLRKATLLSVCPGTI
jgi:hypothetical protein